MTKEVFNVGHGHVYPRTDGVKAKCGGPGVCKECSSDLAHQQREQVPSKKCVLEVFLKYDGFPEKWALRLVRDDGSTFELLESSSPIEVRPYGAGTAPEPPADDHQAVYAAALRQIANTCGNEDPHGGTRAAEIARDALSLPPRPSQPPSDDLLSQIDELLQTMIVSAEVFTEADGTVTGYKIKTGALHKIVGLRTHLFFPQNMKEAERAASTNR